MNKTPKKPSPFITKTGKTPFPPRKKPQEKRASPAPYKGTFQTPYKNSAAEVVKKASVPRLNPERSLFGIHPVTAALKNKNREITKIWATESAFRTVESSFNPKRHPAPHIVERHIIDSMLPDSVHQGIALEVNPLEETFLADVLIQTQNDDNVCLVVLDQVTDPHNVGAVLRSASAFGAKAVIVHKRNAPQITGTLAKSAVGAVEYVPMVSVVNLSQALDELKRFNFTVVGFDEDGTEMLGRYDMPGRVALVMGAEGEGMRDLTGKKCDIILKLPTQGPIGSLNVSNAAAIALYETVK